MRIPNAFETKNKKGKKINVSSKNTGRCITQAPSAWSAHRPSKHRHPPIVTTHRAASFDSLVWEKSPFLGGSCEHEERAVKRGPSDGTGDVTEEKTKPIHVYLYRPNIPQTQRTSDIYLYPVYANPESVASRDNTLSSRAVTSRTAVSHVSTRGTVPRPGKFSAPQKNLAGR